MSCVWCDLGPTHVHARAFVFSDVRKSTLSNHVAAAVVALLWLLLAIAPDSSQPTAWAWFAVPSLVLVGRAAIAGRIATPDRLALAIALPVLGLTALTLSSVLWAEYAPSAALQEGALMCVYVVIAAWAWAALYRLIFDVL